jgi:hypothetical protein
MLSACVKARNIENKRSIKMAQKDEVINLGVRNGFSTRQMQFLTENFALHPHEHEIEDIEGLPETLNALGIDTDEEDEEEEEGDTGED